MNAPHQPPLATASRLPSWSEQNQQWLMRELASLRARIDAQALGEVPHVPDQGVAGRASRPELALDGDFVSTLDRCSMRFGLSSFERELLLLTAGVELDNGLRESVVRAHGQAMDGGRTSQPTFALAFRALQQPHWDALSPQAPLRRWRLIEMESRRSPTLQPLYIDERVLHFLCGVEAFDERLLGLVRVEPAPPTASALALAQRIARALTSRDARAPLVVLTQDRSDPESLHGAAREGLAGTSSPGLWLLARDLPNDAASLAQTAVLIDREAALLGGLPIVELDVAGEAANDHEQRGLALLSHLLSPAVLIGGPEAGKLSRLARRHLTRINVPAAKVQAQAAQLGDDADWAEALAQALRPALQQFRMSSSALHDAIDSLQAEATDEAAQAPLAARVWQACRDATRGGLDVLAQRVESQARFDDLVLPANQTQLLREIAEHLNHRHTVYEQWGIGGKTTRGRGLCVLFAGESGTGKTLAAEAIANEAALDLYRVDLATLVSKYIGETEKNLKRVFDAAEASGCVLLFDEADALYGKRSDVKDSHDRYANIEVAYLLQRVEAYRGLAILTSNFRSALDRAFMRRIRFIVQFPFPDEAAREQIWRRELVQSAPMEAIDFKALARAQLSGGHISSIVLNAAFIAAGAGTAISMLHLRHAAHREAAKLDRPLNELGPRVWA